MGQASTQTSRRAVVVEVHPRAPRGEDRARSQRWPYVDPDPLPLPATLPDGRPWPRISVVTPSYNQGSFIEETILSVLHQGYPDVEHIIVDGVSTDETPAVLDRYRDRLAKVVVEPDEGQGDAINKGMALATGDILTWLNSDDQLAPGALPAVAMALAGDDADMVAGECHVFQDGRLIHRHLTSCEEGPLPLDDLLDLEGRWLVGQFFYQPEVMFTRELWERVGGRVATQWHYSMDYELWLRFAQAGAKLKVIGRPVTYFRAHEAQKTAGTEVGGFRAELPRVVDDFLEQTGYERSAGEEAQPLPQRLRIVLFNDMGYRYGAGIAHGRVAQALTEAGHDVHALDATQNAWTTTHEILAGVAAREPDLVVVGNLHAARISPTVLGKLARRFPTAFLLHDLWLLTGGCAYPGNCERYLTGCSEACTCPNAYPKPEPTRLAELWEAKRTVLGLERQPALLANSRWTRSVVERAMREAVAHATLQRQPPLDWVRFGIELDDFRPYDRADARAELGLPPDRFLIMTSASSLVDKRKGLADLITALGMLEIPDVMVIAAGHGRQPSREGGIEIHRLGYIGDRTRLAKAYAAADIFVGPSLEEAFGQVFVEAAACGTPSVGYPVGGVPEAIAHGTSGLLAPEVTPEALAHTIDTLWRDEELRRNLGLWGRRWAEASFSMAASAHRFHGALRSVGIPVRRKLSLACAPVEVPPTTYTPLDPPYWVGIERVENWEGPLPDVGLDRFRWAHGPRATIGLHPAKPGTHDVVLLVRNFHNRQAVRLEHEGRTLLKAPIPVTGHEREHVIRARLELPGGVSRLDLHFETWRADSERPLAVLIHDLMLLPVS